MYLPRNVVDNYKSTKKDENERKLLSGLSLTPTLEVKCKKLSPNFASINQSTPHLQSRKAHNPPVVRRKYYMSAQVKMNIALTLNFFLDVIMLLLFRLYIYILSQLNNIVT